MSGQSGADPENTVKPVLSGDTKKDQTLGFKTRQHSVIILTTCINLPFVFKTFVLFIVCGRLRQILL